MFGKTKVRRSIPGAGILRPSSRPTARAAAVFLSVCLAFTMMPTPALAVTPDQAEKTGLCEHHPKHTAECGYQEAKPGQPCGHKHVADCYTDELICGYKVNGGGAEREGLLGGIEDKDVTATGSDAGHKHTQDCYKLDCPHERGEHRSDCGYTEGEAGVPCGYVCELCGQPDKIDTLCAAIDALPTVEELYENAPGDGDSNFGTWVTETRAKLAEVPALWEQLTALSEDAAAMERITKARAEKLEALNNLAARLKEMETLEANGAAPGGSDVKDASSLQTALGGTVNASVEDSTVKLEQDVTLENNIKVTGTVALDLNGHTLSFAGTGSDWTEYNVLFYIGQSGNLTIKDSAGNGQVEHTRDQPGKSDYAVYCRYDSSQVTIENGAFSGGVRSGLGSVIIEDGTFSHLTVDAAKAVTVTAGKFDGITFMSNSTLRLSNIVKEGSYSADTSGEEINGWKNNSNNYLYYVWIRNSAETEQQLPKITTDLPTDTIYCKVNDSKTLSITATVGDGSTLTYQWYQNSRNSAPGTEISGANTASYTVPTTTAGTTYYYVEVTNPKTGISVRSNIAAVVVSASGRGPGGLVNSAASLQNTLGGIGNATIENSTVKLDQDVTLDSNIKVTGTVSLDLNGHTISFAGIRSDGTEYNVLFYIGQSGNLTIKDSAGNGKVEHTRNQPGKDDYAVYCRYDSSHVTIENGVFSGGVRSGLGSVIIEDGTFSHLTVDAAKAFSVAAGKFDGITFMDNSLLKLPDIVKDGSYPADAAGKEVSGWKNNSEKYLYNIWIRNGAEAEKQLPKITADLPADTVYCKVNDSKTLSITATVGDGSTLAYQWYQNSRNSAPGTEISGANTASYTVPTTIAGTTYYYVEVTNPKTGISVRSNIAAVAVSASGRGPGGSANSNASLQNTLGGIDNATIENGTVKLAQNVTLDNNIKVTGTVSLDLNGHTISFAGTSNSDAIYNVLFYIGQSGNLTIKDSAGNGQGKVEHTRANAGRDDFAVYCRHESARVTIENGVFSGGVRSGLGSVIIEDGTFSSLTVDAAKTFSVAAGKFDRITFMDNSTYRMPDILAGNSYVTKNDGQRLPDWASLQYLYNIVVVPLGTGSTTTYWLQDQIDAATGTSGAPTEIRIPWDKAEIVSTIAVPEGKYIKLTGNALTRSAAFSSSPLFNVKGELTLENITLDGNKANVTGDGLIEVDGGKLTLNTGAVLQNGKNSGNGGAVRVCYDGSVIMNGGKISGNEALAGGGVYVFNYLGENGGIFTMNGGEISGNTAEAGSGVYITQNSTFNLHSGAVIKGNAAPENVSSGGWDGIINVELRPTFNVLSLHDMQVPLAASYGITIPSSPDSWGGGVYNMGTFTMDGGEISDNTAGRGGAVYHADGTCSITGGSISGNHNTFNGAGLYAREDFSIGANANIADGIYLVTGKKALVTSGLSNNIQIEGMEGTPAAGTVVASGSSYTITEADFRKFSVKDTGWTLEKNVDNQIVLKTATPDRTEAPAFSSTLATFTSGSANAVTFPLINALSGGSYKVYAAAEGGSALTDPTVSVQGSTLTLTFAVKPTQESKYYISATTGGSTESTRTQVTVSPYVAPIYGVTLDPSGNKTFAAATVGYGEQSAHTVTINNSGNQPTGDLTIALSGANTSSFILSATSISSIGVDGSSSFTVKPNTGMLAGTYTATVTVSGSNSISASFGVSFTVNTQPSGGTVPAITTDSLPGGTVGTAYSQTLTATGTTPITWSVNRGNLPDGLELNSDGIIIGSPTAAGPFTFTVKAENSAGSNTKEFFIQIATPAPTVTGVTVTPERTDVQKGSTRQFSATVTGANNPAQTVTWSIEGRHADGTGISNAGLLTVAADETVTTLIVKATSTVDTNKNGTATVNITNTPLSPTYGISLSQSGIYTFAGATVGYGEQTPLTVTVTNTGNQPTGPLSVQISGEGRDAFTPSSPVTIDSIAPGGTGAFTVKPVTGLPARTYTAAVSVSGSNLSTARFDMTFTVSPAQQTTYTISGTIRGSDTGSGIAAVLQLKDSQNANAGAPVTAGADGSYTITGIPAGVYQIEVSCAGYDSGIIDGIVVSDGDVTGRDLTLHKTVTFIPVTGITMTSASTVEVNTSLPLTGTVSPDNATNRTIVWSVEEADGTGATISGSTFRAVTPGTATVKATVAKGLAASTPYEKTFTITVTAAPTATHTITASAGSGGTISPSGAVAVNEGESQTFTITTDSNYRISQVTVDGVDKGAVAAYTFEYVTADHSIFVTFRYIGGGSSGGGDSSSSGGGGSSPSGSSSSAPSTTTSTTAGENGTSTTTTQTTSKDNSGKTTTVTTEMTKDAAGNTTGSATTVTTDNITAQADQGSSIVTVKPDAAAIGGAAKAAGASETNPMDISVAVPQDTVKNELQKEEVSTVHVDVILPKSVADNPAVGTAGVTVEKETVDAARQTGKNVTVTVREDTGTVKAVWTLDGQAMGNAAGQSTDLNLGVRTAPVQSNDPIAAPVKPPVTAAGQENGLVISLTADGTLLSSAKLTVPATNQTAITAGSAVALYRFDQNTGALSAIPGGVYLVDENGNVTIDIPAGTRAGAKETYVLLPVPAASGTSAAGGGGGGGVHTIKAGDTLNQIGRQYGCRVEDLLALNPGVDIYNLQIGSDLRIR